MKPSFTNKLKVYLIAITALGLGLKKDMLYCAAPKYSVEFRGVYNIQQIRSLKDASSLVRFRRNAPNSLAALRYRANQDVPQFLQVLHAYSFYDACITTRAFRQPSGKYKMVIAVDKGAPYLISQFDYRIYKPQDVQKELYDIQKVKLEQLGIKLGKPGVSTKIVDAEKHLISHLTEHGYPFAKIRDKSILVDQAQKTMQINLQIEEGPQTHFGPISIEGGQGVRRKFIQNRIAWKEGELFSSKKIAETEQNLYDSGLFAIVSITPDKKLNQNQKLPVHVELLDAKYNNFTVGGSYTTTWEGLGGSASWQNRNIFSSGLDLKLNYAINQKRHETGLEFIFPDIFGAKNRLIAQSQWLIENEMPNYREKGVDTHLYIERVFSRYFKMSLGTRFDLFDTTNSLRNGYYSLLGIPFFLNLQSSDKVLINPTQGGWFSVNFSPYFGMNQTTDSFAEAKFEGSVYQYLIPSKRIILAMNVVLGSLFGSSLDNVPPSYRYYAGSPQHLRGYPYEKVSPLDSAGRETGGRSIFLWSIEPRVMVLKSVAVVGFFDVGNVYRSQWLRLRQSFAKSLGVGVRYYSIVGPLRLDIGFPLNRRANIDGNYQIYFSIGQAF